MKQKASFVAVLLLVGIPALALAEEAPKIVTIHEVSASGIGSELGTVTLSQTPKGTRFKPDIRGLVPGVHGFHVHENPSCESGDKDGVKVAGLKAGGHYDPDKTGRHEGPVGKGHRGDLPLLTVSQEGVATTPVIAPRLTLKELSGRSLMIHVGGDNYMDKPLPLGGGGARMACGVIR